MNPWPRVSVRVQAAILLGAALCGALSGARFGWGAAILAWTTLFGIGFVVVEALDQARRPRPRDPGEARWWRQNLVQLAVLLPALLLTGWLGVWILPVALLLAPLAAKLRAAALERRRRAAPPA